jgi:hypothetical protein
MGKNQRKTRETPATSHAPSDIAALEHPGPTDPHDPMLQHVLLTVTAIIQAVAFTELVRAPRVWAFPPSMTWAGFLPLLQGLAVFQVIVLTWHEVLIFMLGYRLISRKAFGLRESYFPFAMGLIEVQLVLEIGTPRVWCRWLAMYLGAVFLANVSMYRKLSPEQQAFPERFGSRFDQFKLGNLALPALLCAFFAAVARGVPPLKDSELAVAFLALNLLCLVVAYSASLMWDDLRPVPERSKRWPW